MKTVTALSVASEIYPLIKTGGLADVVGALPAALQPQGITMRTLVPGYPAVLEGIEDPHPVYVFADLFGGPARLLAARQDELELLVLDAPHLYARPGNPYVGPDGEDWPDNAFRFGALAKMAALVGQGLVAGFLPQIVHAHDWQAGLTPAYLRYSGKPAPASVFTIHNLAYQGQFPRELLGQLGLPDRAFSLDGVEYYGAIGYLKAGLQLADRITTVSPTYAQEIQGPEAGMGLDGLLRLRAKDLSGILNGIDDQVWDPATDIRIPANFDLHTIAARSRNKQSLQGRFGLRPQPGTQLIGVISRLSWQKGLDMLIEVLPTLLADGTQLALLGSGDPTLEAGFRAAALAHPGQVGVVIGYDESLAHLVQAGADALLVPSRFEPCGLTQLCAMRYGAVPVVARVGGLADTVVDANEMALSTGVATGVQFSPVTADALAAALLKTRALFADHAAWRNLQINGMTTDVSWTNPAQHYAKLYRDLLAAR
ncbi:MULTISPECIES: glycogen synthase GlgA [Rhodopseudomonas]|uniref:Glycogen synthase n=1 Tax=Rhodopseudomonas palustris TaxID=1076 RepID=A0A0D7ENU0_RHOPL|nr:MULTISPECIES: glycogen synthase GlgA [Rhodopseudomonas]KIZ42458.1 glycogen synthase [Rhodopseudomonas palustris]MDF3812164.1 glycogen synthase GlgA [Rhodopseudomonas sp. BAL398]WOK16554.1 glycogen synthase GlgA [Rhodopseudomonas sp. BAL398]